MKIYHLATLPFQSDSPVQESARRKGNATWSSETAFDFRASFTGKDSDVDGNGLIEVALRGPATCVDGARCFADCGLDEVITV
jgi:hypothetical protein